MEEEGECCGGKDNDVIGGGTRTVWNEGTDSPGSIYGSAEECYRVVSGSGKKGGMSCGCWRMKQN